MSTLEQEHAALQSKLLTLKEDLTEREGQLHVVRMNLETSETQNRRHAQSVSRYEESLTQLQVDLEQSQEEYRSAHAEVSELFHTPPIFPCDSPHQLQD